jgi:tetratricopeptide (TPR) repeat protein
MARATVAGYLGRAYTLTRAIEILNEAVGAATRMELMVDQAMRLAHLGEAYLQIGQVEQATSIAHLALQTSLNYQQRGADAWTQWLLGEINTRADNLGAAEGHYCKAMALASKLGMAPLLAHCHFGLGKGHGRSGRNKQSWEHLVAAANLYRTLEMPSWRREVEMTVQRSQVSLQS